MSEKKHPSEQHENVVSPSQEHAVRIEKVAKLREQQVEPWPVSRPVNATMEAVLAEYKPEAQSRIYEVAGRVIAIRHHGKTIFAHIQDKTAKLQIYVKQDVIGDDAFERFKEYIDIGDIIWCKGESFMTKMGEVTLKVLEFVLLSKCLHPLPEKFHGLVDVETKYRQRYLDLISNAESRHRFKVRSEIIQTMRSFLNDHGFMEVETPMLHSIPGGAVAKPFVTHHNALNMDLFLRIAPELYLKRLVVGGFERVYEINRCFRNEGISTKHNPEFTTVELYAAYHNFEWMMDFSEELIKTIVRKTCTSMDVPFDKVVLHFGMPFKRITMHDAIVEYGGCTADDLNPANIDKTIARYKISLTKKNASWGEKLYELFDKLVEHKLIQPTFITQFPVEVSPLAKRNPSDERFTDRFELFVAGMELANAFNELNDPFDQAQRFKDQVSARESGDEEAHLYDADFITALEYGLPPTVGFGMGIDRLTMMLTNTTSIKDVILFPTLKLRE